jgi:predicted enzyme related to lactoylglutathione lyase
VARVTGIGGVFFKAKDMKALNAWYAKHLGLPMEEWGGAILKWPEDKANDGGLTVWNLGEQNGTWFDPSKSSFMINYRIDDMSGMVEQLTKAGIAILKGPEEHENGNFAWLLDPEGNKVELWEPRLWQDKA